MGRGQARPTFDAGQSKLRLHVLSSLNEFPIRSRPHAGLEIASLQFPTFREAD